MSWDRNSGVGFHLGRVLTALLLFGMAFGYVEAAVVVYLRALYEPMRQRLEPGRDPGQLFPLVRLDQLEAEGPQHVRRLMTELGREAATLVILAAAGLAVAHNVHQWLAVFMIGFGLWDIFYYVFLKLLLDWPASLFTWDILFLLPAPWVGPVLAPVLVSASMIAAGVTILQRESVLRPILFDRLHWTFIIGGGLTIAASFCWDFRNTSAGGWPNPFNWPLFALGESVGAAAFVHAALRRGRQPSGEMLQSAASANGVTIPSARAGGHPE